MNRQLAIIIALEALLIVVLFWVLVFYGKDEYEAYVQGEIEEEIETPNRVSTAQGMSIVTLPLAAQAQSGIEVVKLNKSQHTNTLNTYGTVVNIDSLIESRNRYLAAKAEASIARASLTNTEQEYKRLKALNQDDKNVSDRAVINAEALLKADQAKLNAAEALARNMRDSIGQQWGEALASQATHENGNSVFNRILQYRDVLIQVTLPFDAAPPKMGSSILVSPTGVSSGTETQTIRADFVSASPQIDTAIQGKTFYYRAPADSLRVGMRLSIKMKNRDKPADGVVMPSSAVVWYGGQAWAYRKEEDNRFTRIPLNTTDETENGWFINKGFEAGDEVVVTGAQLLLSEEFKYQITNENDD